MKAGVGEGEEEGVGEDEGEETRSKCHYNSLYVHLVSFLTAKELYIFKKFI